MSWPDSSNGRSPGSFKGETWQQIEAQTLPLCLGIFRVPSARTSHIGPLGDAGMTTLAIVEAPST